MPHQYASSEGSVWRRFFGIADTLAKTRQAQFRRDWISLFLLSLAGFFLYAFADHFGFVNERQTASGYLLFFYLIAGVIGLTLLSRMRNRRDQERFLDYRAFAEALRVAVYWNILGIFRPASYNGVIDQSEDAVNSVADLYPIKQPSELTWVKNTLRILALCYRTSDPARSPADVAAVYQVVRQNWILGQERYFTEQRQRHKERALRYDFWSLVCFVITFGLILAMIFSILGYLGLLDNEVPLFSIKLRIRDLLLIASGLLPGIAAALNGYSERLAFAAQANQYDRMRLLFKRARDLLPEQLPDDEQKAVWSVLRQLGMEAMKESADWVSIYRQRPIKTVQ